MSIQVVNFAQRCVEALSGIVDRERLGRIGGRSSLLCIFKCVLEFLIFFTSVFHISLKAVSGGGSSGGGRLGADV